MSLSEVERLRSENEKLRRTISSLEAEIEGYAEYIARASAILEFLHGKLRVRSAMVEDDD